MNQELLNRLKKSSTIKETDSLEDSVFFGQNTSFIPTPVPMFNVALAGRLDGGIANGLTVLAGESKRFKTLFALVCAGAYLNKYPDAVLLFYDSEFGTPQSYFESVGIPLDRVIHSPITTVEQLRSDIANQLKEIKKEDHVVIVVDSVGNLASAKELNDALDEKSVADMTRAKQLKSLFRIVTPQLTMKEVPCIVVNHTYKCGVGNTLVRTLEQDGSLELKQIKTGDFVLTTNGYEKVIDTVCYENVPITDIELEDGTMLSFTEFHKFKVNGEWISVSELEVGMELDHINKP